MKNFDEKKAILKLILSNKKGVTKENIIEYLDYINKIRYSDKEIEVFLEELKKQNKVKVVGQLWYSSNI